MTSPDPSNSQASQNDGPALRQCPTLTGNMRSLITHRIEVGLCMKRQREFYHKCHRCQYRGQPAGFVAEEPIELTPIAETGVPSGTVPLPATPRGE